MNKERLLLLCPQPDLKEDARILMAKLSYVLSDYSNAISRLDFLEKIDVEASSNRKMRLIGEAYAIKGTF